MRKRILIAEKVDATRSVTESVLRQNGFEVISVSDVARALEVLEFSRPDLIVVGADLTGTDGRPLYEALLEKHVANPIPLLVIHDAGKGGLPFPPEIIVTRPIDSRELLQKAMTLSGASPEHIPAESKALNPLGDQQLDDDFLDAALGLDNINVTDSEVIDKTSGLKQQGTKRALDDSSNSGSGKVQDDTSFGTGKVESLMIRDDQTDIKRPDTGKIKQPPAPHGTGGIEIAADQYGLTDPSAPGLEHEGADHDYNWFVSSMRDDNEGVSAPHETPATPEVNDSGGLRITETSSMVSPETPGPTTVRQGETETKGKSSGGVEKFIDEFKREVEAIRSAEPESISIDESASKNKTTTANLTWEEKLETLTPDEVGLFTRYFAQELAERVAVKIVSKIDPDKLLQLIKEEIVAQAQKDPNT